jgi:hypothetical protein
MKAWKSLVPVLALATVGCNPPADPAATSEEEKTGELSFKLMGTDSLGQQYRLRNANFYIHGYGYYDQGGFGGQGGAGATGGAGGSSSPWGGTSLVVSSETNPDDPTITTRVLPGDYRVTLGTNWHLERLTPSGPEPIAQSVLLSSVTQYVYVWDNGVSNVVYRFGVDGELIDFRHGDIVISIDIERPGDDHGTGNGGSGGGFSGSGGFGGAGGFDGAGGFGGF